jgi:antitoxin HicB
VVKYPVRITREGRFFLAEFPDVPEAHTSGETKEECLRFALEALESGFIAYMSDRKDIPAPSRIKHGADFVELPVLAEAKVTLYQAMRQAGMRKADLARHLGWQKSQVDRLLDLRHDSRIDQIEQAFAVLGKRIWIQVGELNGSVPVNAAL